MRASFRGAALVFLALTMWGRGAAQENDPCAEKLKALAGAIENYRFVHGKPPEKLSQLYYQGFVESLSDFVCSEPGHKVLSRSELDEKSDYTLEPMAGVENSVIREKAARAGRPILAAFADGSVRPVAPAVARRDDQAQRRTPPSESGRIDQKKAEEPKLDDGIALFHAGRFHEALASFEQALRTAPGHSRAIYMRGSARLWTNDIHGALEDFRYLAEKDRTVESRRINASLELLAGDRQDAKEIAELLVLEAPNDARVHTLYGQALLWNGDVASATATFARVMQLDPNYSRVLYLEANQFLTASVPLIAEMQYLTVLSMDRSQSPAYYGLGIASEQLGRTDRAIQSFEEYLKTDQTSDYARYARSAVERLRQTR